MLHVCSLQVKKIQKCNEKKLFINIIWMHSKINQNRFFQTILFSLFRRFFFFDIFTVYNIYFAVCRDSGRRTPEPQFKNPRVGALFNKWRQVWLLAMERQRKLEDALEHLNEIEKMKNFDFDDWRSRYLQWMHHNKSRIMDFFRRQDRDHDGKVTRKEFIDGIISSSESFFFIWFFYFLDLHILLLQGHMYCM